MSGTTLLLVDDDASIRRLCSRMLKRLGLDMVEAGNGQEGLKCLEEGGPVHAVLLDLNLPDGNGAEWARQFQQHRPGLPIIYFTGNALPKSDPAAGKHFLSKPFTKDSMKQVLAQAIPGLF